ncbi:MarR family winged helix-turn-helix transcriptional regulator [Sciscionella sediminilitoris]|uniref:MarR family winged helix-turn-helix transcriptional regulator n=1 Tax=Sciscionella sediminilitoris TaxID=1445613 RepID=UPI00068A11C0|nr:MarR family transcriptional regulator [Sciscionella sp. SE31]
MDEEAALRRMSATTFAVRDLIDASRSLVTRAAKLTGMNGNDLTALGFLLDLGPMGTAELARRLAISGPSATALVDRLEQAGYIERAPSDTDRRRVTMTATAAARDLVVSAWLPAIQRIDAVSRALSESEQAIATKFLAEVTEALDRSFREE